MDSGKSFKEKKQKMRKIILLLTLVLCSCFEEKRNVEEYKTGKFEFVQTVNGLKQTTILERTDSLQIETFNQKTDTATVRWVSESEFVLQKINPKSMKEEKAISMKILSSSKLGYQFEYSFVGEEKKEQGFVTKLNKQRIK